ncbi:unnamed protein product [Mucor hiemalis]
MSDLNWCTYCDNAISAFSNSLYCSENCLRSDALNHHPLLGYDYAELKDFPRSTPSPTLTASSCASLSPCLSPMSTSFKEVPAFQLNTPKDDSLYHHFYQQKEKKTNPSPSPILLTSWNHYNNNNSNNIKIAF